MQTLMEAFGWRLDRERGSHAIFVKEGGGFIAVPKAGGRMVGRVYLDQICILLGLDSDRE